MRRHTGWLLMGLTLYAEWAKGAEGAASAAAGQAAGLCRTDETVYFACQTTRSRTINLCGGPAPGASLQYRLGHRGKAELQYPADPTQAGRSLFFSHYMRSQVDRVEVRFENQGNEYVVFDYTEGAKRRSGVRVTTRSGKEQELACVGPVSSRLSEPENALPCDVDSALNGGKCPR